MYNWSVDTTRLQKQPEKHELFVLQQQINFGLDNQKLSVTSLKKHWHTLVIDESKKRYLHALVWSQS